jgi:L-amino acid N-acyltransferase YncA
VRAAKALNHKGRARKPQESPWIKGSLIPKGDPNRHKIRWSSSESSSFDSHRASSGWGTRRKRDQNNSAELADWAGGIGPASIDWDSRSRFRDHQSAEKIEKWLDQNVISMEQFEAAIIAIDGSSFTQGLGDIAPTYWFVAHLDGKSAKFFWQQHIDPQDDDVKPCDEEDLQGATPWWDRYVDSEQSMLKPFDHPQVAGIDPDENPEQRRARENDRGAVHAGESRKASKRAKKEAQRKRTLEKREKAHKLGTHDPSSNAIRPGLSLFLRPATKEDMVPLRDIYNRYIDNAFVVPETDRLTESDMLARWQAIKNAKLPFIVACQRGEVIKARKKFHEDMIMPDKVIGFACAADWSDGTCIYRPTVNLEVFVHMEQYMKQVGSCLADKIMAILDPQFADRGGYDIDESLRGEPLRTVSNVLVRYSYEAEKTEKLKWVSKWLKSRFGFEKVADLQGVAEKFDKQ